MSIIENDGLYKFIPARNFDVCLIDGKTRDQISKLYERKEVTTHKSCYFFQKFEHHIKLLENIDLKEYCKKYLKVEDWPKCPINGEEVGFKIFGKGLRLSKFVATVTREFSPSFDAACIKMSEDRKGDGNPMYGLDAWNKGLTKETDNRIKQLSESRIGWKASEETKKKQSDLMYARLAKSGPIHAMPHSPETCEKMRKHTANLWATGVFRKITSIHIKMREFLETLNLKERFREEYQVVYYSLDFAFEDVKLAIECDGDYFHCNPTFYPDGPKTAVQRRNSGRDKAKNKFLDKLGWKVIRFWECEINAGSFKEKLICKLKELDLLKD